MEPERRKHLLITAIILIVLTTVFALTGVHRLLSAYLLATLDPWMHAEIAADTRAIGRETELQEQVLRLNALNVDLRRRLSEYEDIYQRAGLLPPLTTRRARILSRSERGRHYLRIDAGGLEGVRRDDPVLVGWSLIGLVSGEAAHHSLVQLLTDMECRVPAAIYRPPAVGVHPTEDHEERWVADCIVLGTGRWNRLTVDYIEPTGDVKIEPGMQVLTSGIDGHIPPGLVIGTVVEPDDDQRLGHTVYEVAPLRPWGTYHSLLVLIHQPEESAAE